LTGCGLPDEEFQRVLCAAQAGAEWAVATLYRERQPGLIRYLRARRAADAEDVASDVWLDVARSLGRFEGGEADFRRWLFTLAHRRLVDATRREARRRSAPVPTEALAAVPAASDTEAEALGGIASEAALREIAALPRDQAEVVLLRVVAGLSADDVAALMGKRPGTIRVLQHRALARLAKTAVRLRVTI
jgi:RNA polymerase sigma-70 factor, ECF subfamily